MFYLDNLFLLVLSSHNGCAGRNERLVYTESAKSNRIDIFDCIFETNSPFEGNGGAICINSMKMNFSVSDSTFFECSCTGFGGAVFGNCSNSSMIRTCSLYCSNNGSCYGAFASLYTNNHSIYLDTCSISQISVKSSVIGLSPLDLNSGFQNLLHSNISKNYVRSLSALQTVGSYQSDMSFLTIINCQSIKGGLISFIYGSQLCFHHTNIINNTKTKSEIAEIISKSQNAAVFNNIYFILNAKEYFNFDEYSSVRFQNSFLDIPYSDSSSSVFINITIVSVSYYTPNYEVTVKCESYIFDPLYFILIPVCVLFLLSILYIYIRKETLEEASVVFQTLLEENELKKSEMFTPDNLIA